MNVPAFAFAVLFVGWPIGQASVGQRSSSRLILESLDSRCALTRAPVEPSDPRSETWLAPGHTAAWLNCGCGDFLVNNPLNLVRRVKISSAERALEYVRFFTSPETYSLFDLNGMVEIFPGKVSAESPLNIVAKDRFMRCCHEATVESAAAVLGLRVFYLKRTVVLIDQLVYEIVEEVREDGYYEELSRKRVASAEELGISHLGAI